MSASKHTEKDINREGPGPETTATIPSYYLATTSKTAKITIL